MNVEFSHRMLRIAFLLLILSLTACGTADTTVAQKQDNTTDHSNTLTGLKNRVDAFNDAFKYDSALILLQQVKQSGNDSTRYVCFILESQTYKRLFKYDEVLRCLDSAQHYGAKCKNPAYYQNTITAERAFALFDIQHYQQADTLMQALRKNQFRWLTNQQKAFLIMQEGYLEFRNKHYENAESLYGEAIRVISIENEKDLPVIYGKQIELLLAQKKDSAAIKVYERACASADSNGVLKYKMYANDMMRLGFLNREDYKQAYFYIHIGDSLTVIYNQSEHVNALAEVEAKYQSQQKEQALISSRNKEMADQRLIAFLFTALITLSLSILLFFLLRRQRKARRDKKLRQHFTAQLFEKTEEERKRIAVDLHDGISHELLQLKASAVSPENSRQIEHVINEIRNISRNLHPAMFERVGLKLSIENLAERIEQQFDFLISLELEYEQLFSSATELQIYRIIQEALNNVLKHANAHAAFISLKTHKGITQLIIKDNGTGFSIQDKIDNLESFGIHNIIERTEAIGGKVHFASGDDGTSITITIPNSKK